MCTAEQKQCLDTIHDSEKAAKEPYISAKEPYVSAKEPYISAKVFYVHVMCLDNQSLCV